uniref:Uncharacterized protein n=1 Tax=Caenorhabditis japonica TaxID=281687 RepID=A0A8R1I9M8_CAEJA
MRRSVGIASLANAVMGKQITPDNIESNDDHTLEVVQKAQCSYPMFLHGANCICDPQECKSIN